MITEEDLQALSPNARRDIARMIRSATTEYVKGPDVTAEDINGLPGPTRRAILRMLREVYGHDVV